MNLIKTPPGHYLAPDTDSSIRKQYQYCGYAPLITRSAKHTKANDAATCNASFAFSFYTLRHCRTDYSLPDVFSTSLATDTQISPQVIKNIKKPFRHLKNSFMKRALLVKRLPSLMLMLMLFFASDALTAQYYVNDGSTVGDHYTTAIGNDANNGTAFAPFATIQHAISVAGAGNTIYVDAGTYTENIIVSKSLTINGSNANISPCSSARNAESIVIPAAGVATNGTATSKIISVTADNVTIDGLSLDGNNPALSGAFQANGSDIDIDMGISCETAATGNNITIRNNIIKNVFQFGVALGSTGGAAKAGMVTNNKIDNVPYWAAIICYDDYYARIINNCISNAWMGIQVDNFYQPKPGGTLSNISNNTITTQTQAITGDLTYTDVHGMLINNIYQGASAWTLAGNSMVHTGAGSREASRGIELWSIQNTVSVTVTSNIITDFETGYLLWNNPSTGGHTISGGTVTNANIGVVATNYDYYGDAGSSNYVIDNVSIQNSVQAAIYVNDSSASTNSSTVSVAISNGTLINNSSTGLLISGADASASFTGATPASFTGQAKYIDQVSNGINTPAATIDATAVSFDGLTGSTATLAQSFAIEDKINHKIDWSALGFVSVKGSNAFVTINSFIAPNTTTAAIQRGIDAPGVVILTVGAGVYRENLTINKNIQLRGANFGINPNTGTRGAETEIQPAVSDGDPSSATYGVIVSYTTSVTGASIDGFTLNGDNPTLTSGYIVGGADVDAQTAISAEANIASSFVTDNIIKNISLFGVEFYNTGTATTGNVISNNKFDNFLDPDWGIGVLIYNNAYTSITNNVMTKMHLGIQTGNFYAADPGTSHTISNNAIQSDRRGLFFNLHYSAASTFAVSSNTFTNYPGQPLSDGIFVSSIQGTTSATFTGNNITGNTYGYALWNNNTTNKITISGGTVTGSGAGVYATNYFNTNTANSDPSSYIVDGVSIQNSTRAGIFVNDSSANTNNATVSVAIKNSTIINNATTGLLLSGADASATFTGTTPALFTGQAKYIDQISNSINTPATAINATAVSFDGQTGATATLAQNFAIEDKINHKPDWSSLGFVTVKAGNKFVTTNSFISPNTTAAQIQPAVDIATTGDIVNVANGTYNGDLNINQSITLQGQSIAAIIRGLYAGSTHTVTVSANNVTVKDVTITRDYGTTLQNWYDAGTKTEGIIAENLTGLTLDHIVVKYNRNGVYIHSVPGFVVKNSSITDNRTGFQIWGNLDNGQIINNFINNNFTHGLLVNFDQGPTTGNSLLINYNNLSGNWYSQINFQLNSGTPTSNVGSFTGFSANCNWYGSLVPAYDATNPSVPGYTSQKPSQFGGTDPGVDSDIRGAQAALINYIPFLTSGTDSDPVTDGFQPVSGACTGHITKYYVDDDSNTGDVYTPGVTGNDANQGTATAPFRTISHAIAVASPGDTIYVDAGTYTLTAGITVDRKLTFIGAQAGIDARTRNAVAESMVDAGNLSAYPSVVFDIKPAASGTKIDGFTLTGAHGNQTVSSVWLETGTSGDTIQNNIIRNNTAGIFLANNSAVSQTLITKNLFANNNAAGPTSGTDIYADQYTAGTNMQNVLIKDNTFTNTNMVVDSWALGISNTGTSAFTNITFQGNQVTNHGRGAYFYGTSSGIVTGNTFTGTTNYAIGLFDGGVANSAFTVTGNTFTNNAKGIYIDQSSAIQGYTGTLAPTGNTFTGNTYNLINSSTVATTAVINAVGNTYDGVVLDGSTSSANIYAIADKVLDNVDVSTYGAIILKAGNVYETVNSFFAPTTTAPDIQRAVNAASDGNTVNIGPGSYTNVAVAVNKSLSFKGNNSGTSGLASRSAESFIDNSANPSNTAFAIDPSKTVSFDGVKGAGVRFLGLNSGVTASVINSVFNWISTNGGQQHIDGNGSTFASFTFQNNNVTVNGPTQNAIQLFGTALSGVNNTILIKGNHFYGGIPAAGDGVRPVIINIDYMQGEISQNDFDQVDIGVLVATGCGNLSIKENDFHGLVRSASDHSSASYAAGVVLFTPPAYTGPINILNNFFRSSDLGVRTCCGAPDFTGLTVNINNNSFTSNAYYNIRNLGTGTPLSATCNWYGTTDPAVISSSIVGPVTFVPFLTNGTDNDLVTPGFQPVPGSCGGHITNYYVNDGSTTGDVYTTAIGNDGNVGTASSPFATMAFAIAKAQAGDTVTVDAGTYNENVTVTKSITILGAGSTTVFSPSSSCSGNGITINASNTTLKHLKATGYTNGIVVAASTVLLYDVESSSNCTTGIEMSNGISGLTVRKSKVNNNTTVGLRAGTSAQMSNITIDSSEVKGNLQGTFIAAASGGGNLFDNITIKNSDFSNNTQKGMYFEKLSNATFDNVVMNNSGTDAAYNSNAGLDINLKYGSYSNITVKNSSFTNSGANGTATTADNAVAIAIKGRDDAPSYNTLPATVSNVQVINNFISGPQNGLRFGEPGKTNAAPTDVHVHENNFSGTFANKAIVNNTSVTTDATCNWFGTTTASAVTAKVSGSVTYTPFLTNGTDNDVAPGFQPVPNSCNGGLICESAQSQAYTSTLSNGNQAHRGELGLEFVVNNAAGITIKQLGAFDDGGNGITGLQPGGGVRVAIFKMSDHTIVPGLDATIVGTAGTLTGKHRMVNITPVNLPQGNYVVVAKGYGPSELNGNQYNGGGPYPAGDEGGGAVSYPAESSYGPDDPNGFNYPVSAGNFGGGNHQFLAGSFAYTTTSSCNTPSNNADLSNLVLNTATLSPAFAASTTSYTSSVANNVTSVTVTPTVASAGATVKVNNTTVVSGTPSGSIALAEGNNTITVDVKSPDNLTTKTYTIIVTRATSSGSCQTNQTQAYTSNVPNGSQGYRGELGMEFIVNNASGIVINQLGAFDDGGNGITGLQPGGSIRVAVFNRATHTIVAGLDTYISGTTDPLSGNHRMKAIPPVTLAQGDYVIVAKGYGPNEFNGNSFNGGGPFPAGDNGGGAVTYGNNTSYGPDDPNGFSYPTDGGNFGGSHIFLAGSFGFYSIIPCPGGGGGTCESSQTQAYTSNITNGSQAYMGELGMEFIVNSAAGINVKQLGAFDDGGNGITGTQPGGVIRVAIFNRSTHTIVPGLDVNINGSEPLVSNHRMKDITPVNLPQGDYTVVAKGYGPNELNGNAFNSGTPFPLGNTQGGAVTYGNQTSFGSNDPSGFSYPGNEGDYGASHVYMAGNFSFTASIACPSTRIAAIIPDSSSQAKAAQTTAGKGLMVYPNPTRGQFNVQLKDVNVPKLNIQIISPDGRTVQQRTVSVLARTPLLLVSFNLVNQPSGIYMVKVEGADGVKTEKVVIQR